MDRGPSARGAATLMRVLLATGHGHLPEAMGGAQSSTRQLAESLTEAGHEVAILCALWGVGWTGFKSRVKKRVTRAEFACDRFKGHLVFRGWNPAQVDEVVERFHPDVAVVQQWRTVPIARALRRHGVAVVFYFRNVEFEDLQGDPGEIDDARFICNSRFSAAAFRHEFGIEATVIPPGIDPRRYATAGQGRHVTLINPHPQKGGLLATEIARACPEIPFLFVHSWMLDREMGRGLQQRLKALRNVRLLGRRNDMRSVYRRTRILLAPSQWCEAWGRVATEAHCSGIPVIGSNRGGLPEAIGEGGVVLAHDAPVEEWATAIRRLWDDPDEWARYSAAARRASARPELNLDWQLRTLVEELRSAVEAVSPGREAAESGWRALARGS